MIRSRPRWVRRLAAGLCGATVALASPGAAAPAAAQVLVAGTTIEREADLTPEQEQRLLNEYWTLARKYRTDPLQTVAEFSKWTRDRIGKVQAIQFQPEAAGRPEYLDGKAEWNPDVLRMAAMLHSDLAIAALEKRNIPEFEYQHGIADGWFILADNRQSAPGSLRSRWTVSVARLLLAGGEPGIAERILNRAAERIAGDAAILLAQGTVRETQATRYTAEVPGGRLEEVQVARRARDAALMAAQASLERALALDPTLAEARVRLAHVFILKKEDARAGPLVAAVMASNAPAPLKYLAALLAGGLLERDLQIDAAIQAYLQAITAVPDGQSGYLALANLLQRSGRPADAAGVMDRWFARGVSSASADPWWTYPLGLDLSMDAQFEEYRRLVRR